MNARKTAWHIAAHAAVGGAMVPIILYGAMRWNRPGALLVGALVFAALALVRVVVLVSKIQEDR